jgi:hypothetical protein
MGSLWFIGVRWTRFRGIEGGRLIYRTFGFSVFWWTRFRGIEGGRLIYRTFGFSVF